MHDVTPNYTFMMPHMQNTHDTTILGSSSLQKTSWQYLACCDDDDDDDGDDGGGDGDGGDDDGDDSGDSDDDGHDDDVDDDEDGGGDGCDGAHMHIYI